METKAKLGAKAMGRRTLENNENYELRESQSSYNHGFASGKCSLRLKKRLFLADIFIKKNIARSDKRWGYRREDKPCLRRVEVGG
jgi:hypothetical protein